MKIDNLLVQDMDQVNLKIRKNIDIPANAKSLIRILVDKNFYLKMQIEKLCLIQSKKMKKKFLK